MNDSALSKSLPSSLDDADKQDQTHKRDDIESMLTRPWLRGEDDQRLSEDGRDGAALRNTARGNNTNFTKT